MHNRLYFEATMALFHDSVRRFNLGCCGKRQNDASLFAFFESRFLDQLPIILAYGFGIDKAKHWILSILIESEPFATIVFKTFCHVICPSRERNQLIKTIAA